MADTATETQDAPPSTSDRLRSDPPASSFGEIAQKVTPPPAPPAPPQNARASLNQDIEQSLRDQAATVNPKIKEAQEMGEKLVKEAEERRKALEFNSQNVKTVAGQQPSLGLRPFLSTVKGEAPETAIQKFIQALGLFGTAIGGNAKGDARAGLAALTGAMQGWQQGDRERADRAFGDWREKMNAALQASEEERRSYREWFTSGKFSVDQAFAGAEMTALMRGNERAADMFRKGNMDQAVQEMLEWQKHEDTVRMRMTAIETAHSDKQNHEATLRAIAAQKQGTKDADQKAVVESYTEDVLKQLGQTWAMSKDGKLPPGLNRQGAGRLVIPKIIAAGIAWAKENGIDPQQLPAVRMEKEAADKALIDVTKRRSVASVATGTFERHMKQLVELSDKTDRSNRPVIARYQLQAQGQYAGDEQTARYQAMAFEAAQEFAKISVGTAQGDAGSREEARKAINSALNPKQIRGVAEELNRAAKSRMTQYDETIKEIQASVPGLVKHDAPKEGKIRVKRLADGQPGTIDAKDMSSAYEIIQ